MSSQLTSQNSNEIDDVSSTSSSDSEIDEPSRKKRKQSHTASNIETSNIETSKRKRKKDSSVWQHFSLNDVENLATCKHCTKGISYKSSDGTSNLWSHNGSCKLVKKAEVDNNKPLSPVDILELEEQMLRWVSVNMHAYTIVEEQDFRKLFSIIRPDLNLEAVPMADKIRRLQTDRYNDIKQILITCFETSQSKCSFTLDVWSSISKKSYLGITVHMIDQEWQFLSLLLDFVQLGDSHDIFINTIQEFGLQNKLLAVTMDNHASSDTFIRHVSDWATETGIKFDENNRLRCFAHVLNLAVEQAYEHIQPMIESLKTLISKINNSTINRDKFTTLCLKYNIKVGLISDVCTRWNSTFDMLERAFFLRKIISEFVKNESLVVLIDWDLIGSIINFLCFFKEATVYMSSASYPTLNSVIPYYNELIVHTDEYIDNDNISDVLRNAADSCKTYLLKYYNKTSPLHVAASILDPRLKLNYFDTNNFDEDSIETSKKEFTSLFETIYAIKKTPENIPTTKKVPSLKSRIYKVKATTLNEVDEYLALPVEHEAINPVDYWKANSERFPGLTRMAVDYLGIPGTSVPAECIFSKATNVITKKRNRLKSDTAKEALCLNSWYTKLKCFD